MKIEDLIKNILLFKKDEITPELIKTKKKQFAKENKLTNIPTNMELLAAYQKLVDEKKIEPNENLKSSLRKRSIRSKSGIVPVQVLTKPRPCPGKCIFCPDDATMPKSYINTEPWAMRALLNEFDPIKQVYNRLLSLTMTGHDIDKIEMIVLWWTWDFYPKEYKERLVKSLFDACNTFFEFKSKIQLKWKNPKFSKFTITENINIKYSSCIDEAQSINETASCRIIWLTIETRPEFITHDNCKHWRKLWITRLEVWIQSLYDSVLKANKRWNSVLQIRQSLHRLRKYWFKFCCHFMPWLHKSNIQKDIKTMQKAFSDKFIKPDEIKFYPTSVIPNTELYSLYKTGKYKPLTTKEIKQISKKIQLDIIPPYTRIKRLIRDIPQNEIIAGSTLTNLRQIVMKELFEYMKNNPTQRKQHYQKLYPNTKSLNNIKDFLHKEKSNKQSNKTYIIWWKPDLMSQRNFVALDTRSREISNKKENTSNAFLVVRKYMSSVWQEYFISFEDELGYLYWFVRLLLPQHANTIQWQWLGSKTAIVRELHIYWPVVKINTQIKNSFQHKWFGSKLMELAEKLSKTKNFQKISVISWIWVRKYYEKLWYNLKWTYMVKKI